MYCHNFQIVLQEVPGEISLCFSISGCSLRCEGCHSPFLWKEGSGTFLSEINFEKYLEQYQKFATCVLFMGGEWHEKTLVKFLKIAKAKTYKTCLYTGEKQVSKTILNELTWIKTGKWKKALGGLESLKTNQKFIEIATNTNLNHLFIKK
ncbi:anaerobic ribonucleoside-triphosphate reductase activating protein [Tenacibaculum insulae]|uniref:anaerobic ribonucleoside-triphosphate reductase activating protein n=1 Tax=Tenacibaculum insulae TaxID=2029677 RepID=UPI003AB2DD9E